MSEVSAPVDTADFSGRVALVTGAGRGIGAAIAEALHDAGARVAVTDKDLVEAQGVAKRLEVSRPGTAIAFELDVKRKSHFEQALTTITEEWGQLDIVVNNAGYAKRTPIPEISEKEFDEIVAINMRSVFFSCQVFAPYLSSRGYGRIINVTSLSSHNGGTVAAPHYSAAKGGASTLTRYFARQLAGSGVTVNAVSPGPISSAKDRLAHMREEINRQVPVGRFGEPFEIAAAVALLASERGGFIVGATIDVNGGLHMR